MIVNITATLSMRGQVLQLHAGAAKAAVGMSDFPLGDSWRLMILAVGTVEARLNPELPVAFRPPRRQHSLTISPPVRISSSMQTL